MKTETYSLPAYWASYLINGDASGLDRFEIKEIDCWCRGNNVGNCLDCSDEAGFAWGNDGTDQGGDVLDFTFEVLEKDHA